MTSQQIIEAFERHQEASDWITTIVEPAINQLGYDSLTDIGVDTDTVDIVVEWFGAYQSHDIEHLQFPVELLNQGTDAVFKYLKESLAAKREKEEKERNAATRESMLRQYEALKKEFGDGQ